MQHPGQNGQSTLIGNHETIAIILALRMQRLLLNREINVLKRKDQVWHSNPMMLNNCSPG